jgi:hypothetical protein
MVAAFRLGLVAGKATASLGTLEASSPEKTASITTRTCLAETDVLNGIVAAKQESDGIPWRLVPRDLPAGILSTKDALDDGNAYDSAI